MSRSTRLSTAAHILLYLEQADEDRVKINDIAKSALVHPSRLRQICSMLVQGGFLKSFKGAKGGIQANRAPEDISLFDLCACIQDTNFFALTPHQADPKSPTGAAINSIISVLYKDFNDKFIEYLKQVSIADLKEMAMTGLAQGRN